MNHAVPTPAPALIGRARRAGAWAIGALAVSQLLRFGGNLVLSRLLAPDAFGLMVLINTFMVVLTLISDLGVSLTLVQRPEAPSAQMLRTAWTLQAIRGCGIAALCLVIAGAGAWWAGQGAPGAAGSVYGDIRLWQALAVVSCNAVLQGLESVRLALARREMRESLASGVEVASQAVGLLVCVGVGYAARSFWALVAGAVAAALVRLILSHRLLPGPADRFGWEPAAARELLTKARVVWVSSLTGLLALQGDRVLLGMLVDAHALGQYAIAFLLYGVTVTVIERLVVNVAFPAMCTVYRERPGQVRGSYYRFRLPVDALALGASAFLLAFGPWVVRLLYDARYAQAGHLLQILAVSLAFVRFRTAERALVAIGQIRALAVAQVLRTAALLAGVPLGFWLGGLEGAVWVIALNEAPACLYLLVMKRRHGLVDWAFEARMLGAWAGLGLLLHGLAELLF